MSPIFFLFLIFVVASDDGIGIPVIVCGPNSTPSLCANSCPKTCANYNDTIIHPCPRICGRGCNCNKGFVKDGKKGNECVLPKNCTP